MSNLTILPEVQESYKSVLAGQSGWGVYGYGKGNDLKCVGTGGSRG